MTRRFNELAMDEEGLFRNHCPACKSRNLTSDSGIEGISRLGPNWLRCLECDKLFIKNLEELEEDEAEE